ncbi:MAG: FtsH protease activity modulator HflK [Oscillospiraceae bacterium]|jgi:membrane protease subunit HflK|nr:FtsH protease activity modulator HflK [Oscillospiraceae bacterium]
MTNNPVINVKMPLGDKQKKVLRYMLIAAIALAALFVAVSGVYTVNSGTESVITRFDKVIKTEATPGLHFKIPFIDKRYSVNVQELNRLEFGYRSSQPDSFYINEARMLTGDECLVLADWVITYQVSNSYDYLFRIQDVTNTLRIICEASYRRVVASRPLDDILTDSKDIIQAEILDDLQAVCDLYQMGVRIVAVQLQDAQPPDEVAAAFLDVTSAREEKNSKINQARQYENEKLPAARGEAAKALNDAEAYKTKRINDALGAVARYEAIETEFLRNPLVTRTRLYLEMIQEVLPSVSHIYFVDSGGNQLNFLPLAEYARGGGQ